MNRKLAREIEVIGQAQAMHASLQNELESRGIHVAAEPSRRLMEVLTRGMRRAVTFDEIDTIARELHPGRFDGVSICEVYREAEALAFKRKEESGESR
jgi:hypothetical protein